MRLFKSEASGFSGVSSGDFEVFYVELNGRGRVTYFGAESGILPVQMPTPQHEISHSRIALELFCQGLAMGQGNNLDILGATRYDSIHQGGGAKEGDNCLRPSFLRPYGDSFPTLQIEVSYSRTLAHARRAKD